MMAAVANAKMATPTATPAIAPVESVFDAEVLVVVVYVLVFLRGGVGGTVITLVDVGVCAPVEVKVIGTVNLYEH